jgi:hypothetical protein
MNCKLYGTKLFFLVAFQIVLVFVARKQLHVRIKIADLSNADD